jgi:LDH2 family malate/lactate/ureidoglycolate dehydrogenase
VTTLQHIQPDTLRSVVTQIFVAVGMNGADAHLLADSLVFADLRGVNSHGVMRVPEYVDKLTIKGVNPQGQPQIVRHFGACAVVDGGNSMGQIGMHFAMREAIQRAEEHGIAAVAVRGSNHSGAMAYYAIQALPHDMIGIATTNALPTMAPWGGAEKIVGINPLGIAIPAQRELPIVHDAAFSGSSHGKIRIHHQKGLPIPEGWALDKDGNPTTDAAAAIEGLLRPIGEFKGVSLALIMGILSSMLSGAAYGLELGNMVDGARAGMDGHFVAAIKIAAFEDVDLFKARVDAAIDEIHKVRKATGFERTYAPGEVEQLREQEYLQQGIPLNAVTLNDLRRVAAQYGVDAAFTAA